MAAICSDCRKPLGSPIQAGGTKYKCKACGGITEVTAQTKICSGCGVDVTQRKRMKDAQGNYFCEICGAKGSVQGRTPRSSSSANEELVTPTDVEVEDRLSRKSIAVISMIALVGLIGISILVHRLFFAAHPNVGITVAKSPSDLSGYSSSPKNPAQKPEEPASRPVLAASVTPANKPPLPRLATTIPGSPVTPPVIAKIDSAQVAFDKLTGKIGQELQQGQLEAGFSDCKNLVSLQPKNPKAVSLIVDVCRRCMATCPFQEVASLDGHESVPYAVAISPDGRIAATTASHVRNSSIRIWDIATATCLRSLNVHKELFTHGLAFSPDGKTLLSQQESNESFCVWDVETGKLLQHIYGGTTSVMALSTSGEFVLGGGDTTPENWTDEDNETLNEQFPVRVFEVKTGHLAAALMGHSEYVTALAVSPDGKLLASGAREYPFPRIKIWDKTTATCIRTIKGTMRHKEIGMIAPINSLAFTKDGEKLIASGGKEVKIFDVGSGTEISKLPKFSTGIRGVALLPDDHRLAVAVGGYFPTRKENVPRILPSLEIWDWPTGTRLQILKSKSGEVPDFKAISFSADGTTLISSSEDKSAKIWKAVPDSKWKAEAVALLHDFDRAKETSAPNSGELAWANGARSGEAEAAEAQRLEQERAKIQAQNDRTRADDAQRNEERMAVIRAPADSLCKAMIQNGKILSAEFVDYAWDRGFKSGNLVPSNVTDVIVHYDFTFTTKSGDRRTHRGFVGVRATKNGDHITWDSAYYNIDGNDVTL